MRKTIIAFASLAFLLSGCRQSNYPESVTIALPDNIEPKDMYVEEMEVMVEPDVMPAPPEFNTERYAARAENDFKVVSVNPTSVFSVDVDKASYTNARDYVKGGSLPPEGSVRIEEFINYFNYSYPAPKGDNPVSLNAEIGKCAWNKDHYLLKLGLKAKEIDVAKAPASNLVFLIDVSGSMWDELPLLVDAYDVLMEGLRECDRVAIVTYASGDEVVLNSTPCTAEGRKQIYDALHSLRSGGSTQGSKGIETAYEIAHQNFIKGGNNRVILATDGDFNVGISSTAGLKKLIEKERETNVFLTVLGFGRGNLNDEMMSTIADAGNGNYSYIGNIFDARKALGTELWGSIYTVAKDVKLLVDFNPNLVKAYRLIGYEKRLLNNEDFNNDKKDAGDMGSGHTVTALYELVSADSKEDFSGAATKSEYVSTVASSDKSNWMTVKFRFKNPSDSVSKLQELKVDGSFVKTQNSADFHLAQYVSAFAQVLNNSKYCNMTFNEISDAIASMPSDKNGYIDDLKVFVREAGMLKK